MVSSVRPHFAKSNVLRVVFFMSPSITDDVWLSDMALLRDKSSFLKVLFLCSISVSVGPFFSVILSEQSLRYSSMSDVLVSRASTMYCSPLSPIGLPDKASVLNALVVLNASAMYETPSPVI